MKGCENIQYTFIVGKCKIYLYELYKSETLKSFSNLFRSKPKLILYLTTIYVFCLSCSIKKSKTPAILSENNWNKPRSNRFQWCNLWR